MGLTAKQKAKRVYDAMMGRHCRAHGVNPVCRNKVAYYLPAFDHRCTGTVASAWYPYDDGLRCTYHLNYIHPSVYRKKLRRWPKS